MPETQCKQLLTEARKNDTPLLIYCSMLFENIFLAECNFVCQINQILRVIVEESVHNIRNDQCTLMTIDLCEDDFQ